MRKTLFITFLMLLGSLSLSAQSCWNNFRGDPQFSGVSNANIPDEPDLLWTFRTDNAIKASPVVCNDVIVIGSADGYVYGITMDGKLGWKLNTGNGIEASAMIDDGVAYIGNLDGKIFAIEVGTGKTRWTYATEGQIMGAPNIWVSSNNRSANSMADKILVVGSYDYYLHGVDAETGEGLWKYETFNFLNGAPAIYKGVAVFGGCDGLIHQVNVADGSLKDRKEVASYIAGSVAVDDWVTYVGDYDGRFTCLDLNNGEEKWSFLDESAQQPFIASPSLSKDYVYIGNRDKFVYAFHKDNGELKWKINARGMVDASPVLIDDRLLIATMSGDLMLLDTKDGSILWSYELGSPITGNPAVIDGHIIVGAEDGRIYNFGIKD